MNRDSEALQKSLLRLLQDLIPNVSPVDAEAIDPGLGLEPEMANHQDGRSPNLLFQDAVSTASNHPASETTPAERESLLKLGEIPAVQDRFHALLKHRLQSEIQRNPPLFPWETEIHDYEADSVSTVGARIMSETLVPPINVKVPARLWVNQLKALNLPIQVPEAILAQLLERCQEVVQSSLLEGAKLVRAVEDLFPNQSPALNHLAGLVMTSPARSAATKPPSGVNYPLSYEAAVPAQQMVLSLLTAREIIGALTLTLSANQPKLERQWVTELGALTLQADYEMDAAVASLRIQGRLPSGGHLTLRSNGLQATAQRPTPGYLSVELFDLQPGITCTLEVGLELDDEAPLLFAVQINA